MSWVYLSHVLKEDTPLYGGGAGVRIEEIRSIASGDTSNNSALALPAHAGTHIDAPYHFDQDGRTLEDFPVAFWMADAPAMIDCPATIGEILNLNRLESELVGIPENTDLLLLRTHAEEWRDVDPQAYSERGVGIGVEVARWMREHLRLKFFGVDCVSISSPSSRELGREAHRIFLQSDSATTDPILLIEDMALSSLNACPRRVLVVPMRFVCSDGAPVTVLAEL